MKLQLNDVVKSYGADVVLDRVNIQIKDNEKIALVGRNGCGKTTLLKIICEKEPMDSGSRFVANGTKIGYLSQITFLDETKTVYEELLDAFKEVRSLEKQLLEQANRLEFDANEKELERYDKLQQRFEALNGYQYEVELQSVFFHFQFTKEDLDKPLNQFSSGQKTRIALVKLLLSKPDILLLDEPTNHLDMDSIEWLENYIKHYPFAVILVSHDRMFLDNVVDEIVEIEFGKSMRYVGNYTHYIKAKEEYLLTTKLFCGHCNEMMTGYSGTSKTGRSYHYYICKNTRKKKCDKKLVDKNYLEDLVVEYCLKLLDKESIKYLAKMIAEECKKTEESYIIKDLKNYMIAALLACWFLAIVLCYSGDLLIMSFIFFITLCPLYGIYSTLKAMKKCYEYKFEHRELFI